MDIQGINLIKRQAITDDDYIVDIVEKHNLIGLGPRRNMDYMHIQAVEIPKR